MSMELPPGTAAQRPDRNPPPGCRQILTLAGSGLAVLVLVLWLLSGLVNQLVWWIPPSVEQQLGAIAIPPFELLAPSSATQTQLNQYLDQLELHLPPSQSGRDYQVLYIPQPTVNALAIPGDRIILYEGLLTQMESENELMMVLGHELGHFAHRDHLRSLGRAVVLKLAIASFLGDLGTIQNLAVNQIDQLSTARFSQAQEMRADQFGLELLYQHYGQVAGATDFFERQGLQLGGAIADFWATHPAPQQRVQRLRRLIGDRNYPQEQRVPLPDWGPN